MSSEPYEPKGTRFHDAISNRNMLLVSEGHMRGWLCYRHPDGQWVTLRKATDDDLRALGDTAAEVTARRGAGSE